MPKRSRVSFKTCLLPACLVSSSSDVAKYVIGIKSMNSKQQTTSKQQLHTHTLILLVAATLQRLDLIEVTSNCGQVPCCERQLLTG